MPDIRSLLAGVVGLMLSPAVSAQDKGPAWYAAALVSHVQPDALREQRNAAGGAVLVGWPLFSGINVEVNAFGQEFHGRANGRSSPAYGLGLDFTYEPRWKRNGPFLILGGGGVHEEPDALETTDEFGDPLTVERPAFTGTFARAGLGFHVPGQNKMFSPGAGGGQWRMRVDLSWYGLFSDKISAQDDRVDDVRLNVGVEYSALR